LFSEFDELELNDEFLDVAETVVEALPPGCLDGSVG